MKYLNSENERYWCLVFDMLNRIQCFVVELFGNWCLGVVKFFVDVSLCGIWKEYYILFGFLRVFFCVGIIVLRVKYLFIF